MGKVLDTNAIALRPNWHLYLNRSTIAICLLGQKIRFRTDGGDNNDLFRDNFLKHKGL